MKKILNNPKNVVSELLDGIVEASNGKIKKIKGVNALIKTEIPEGKVGLLIGGGSGHEPLFPGFIGENLADGAACGHIFAAPSPDIALDGAKAINKGKGVLFLYGNYDFDQHTFNLNLDKLKKLQQRHVYNLPFCQDCFCKYMCSGDCPIHSMKMGYNMERGARCEITQMVAKHRLATIVKESSPDAVIGFEEVRHND